MHDGLTVVRAFPRAIVSLTSSLDPVFMTPGDAYHKLSAGLMSSFYCTIRQFYLVAKRECKIPREGAVGAKRLTQKRIAEVHFADFPQGDIYIDTLEPLGAFVLGCFAACCNHICPVNVALALTQETTTTICQKRGDLRHA